MTMNRVFTQYLIEKVFRQQGIYQHCFHFSPISRHTVNTVMKGVRIPFLVEILPPIKRNTTFL